MASNTNGKDFIMKNKDFVLKLRLVGSGTPQIRRVRLPRVAVNDAVSYDELVKVAIQYTFPSAPLSVEEYKCVFTYYDTDSDCVTIASTDELVDAIEQFAAVGEALRITTDVKRKKTSSSPGMMARTPSRGSSPVPPSRSVSPPMTPQRKAQAQLQNALEAFASVLAAAVVAIQSQINGGGETMMPPVLATVQMSAPRSMPTEETGAAAAASPEPVVIDLTQDDDEEQEEKPKKEEPEGRPFIHGRHTCDGCLCTPIVGKRFHALNLPDYDLCGKCRDNYKGDYIQFEEVELERDIPFQDRWHRKRNMYGRGCGPRPRHGRGVAVPARGPRVHQTAAKRDEMALKEALRRSLQDMTKVQKETKNIVKETRKAIKMAARKLPVQDATAAATGSSPTKRAAMKSDEQPTQHKVKEESFSFDAAGNGDVAQVLGETLDQCAEAIDAMMDELDRKSTAAEPEITLEPAAEEHNGNEASAPSADVVGAATIIEATNVVAAVEDEEKSVTSNKSEDDWSVVGEEEGLARAAQAIGSALYQSDLTRSEAQEEASETLESSVSTQTSVPTISSHEAPIPDIVIERWAPQLAQLYELGFYDDRQSIEVLERLQAANIGVDSMDEVTVTQVVNELLKK